MGAIPNRSLIQHPTFFLHVVPDTLEVTVLVQLRELKIALAFACGRDQPFTLSHVVPAGECGCGRVPLVVSAE